MRPVCPSLICKLVTGAKGGESKNKAGAGA